MDKNGVKNLIAWNVKGENIIESLRNKKFNWLMAKGPLHNFLTCIILHFIDLC